MSLSSASALGVVAGLFLAAAFLIDPFYMLEPFFKGFAAAILGGLNSLPGALVGGLLLGIAEALAGGFISVAPHENSTSTLTPFFLKKDLIAYNIEVKHSPRVMAVVVGFDKFFNYDKVVEFNLADELALGKHIYFLDDLFESSNRPPLKPVEYEIDEAKTELEEIEELGVDIDDLSASMKTQLELIKEKDLT